MPEAEFFARLAPEFAEHCGSTRENLARQADVERLLAKVEYEFHLVHRELAAVMPGLVAAVPDAEAALISGTSANSAQRSAKAA